MKLEFIKSILKRHLLICFCFVLGVLSISAQRVFVVSETGIVREAHEDFLRGQNKNLGLKQIVSDRYTAVAVPYPFKIYIYTDVAIDIKDWEFQYPVLHKKLGRCYVYKGGVKKSVTQKYINTVQISDHILEVDFGTYLALNVPSKENLEQWSKVATESLAKGVIVALPTQILAIYKPSKKGGAKQTKVWTIGLSTNEFEPEKLIWTSAQVENSINEIINHKEASQQLFAVNTTSSEPLPVSQTVNKQHEPQSITASIDAEHSQLCESKEIYESDVDVDIPYSTKKQENAFAVIFANENYKKVTSVPYAIRDGRKVKDYLVRTLGFDERHVTLVENATLNDMKYEFNRLSKISEAYKGDISLVIYYSGHGIPDEKNGNGYLLPVDGFGSDVSTAYSTDELYNYLGVLRTKRTVLFLDACFSGASKHGDMLVSARGIAIKSQAARPTGNLIVFSACQGDETAYAYKEKGHGLMTYFLLKKLQDSKGNVPLGELTEYIKDNVAKTAIVLNGKPQTPATSVSPTLVDNWKNTFIAD